MLYTYIRKPCSHFSAGLVISLVHLLYSQITELAFYKLSTSIPHGFRQLPGGFILQLHHKCNFKKKIWPN